jgi:hypothetical protein
MILRSATYRQQSTPSNSAERIDPENRLLSYFSRRRLDFESIRDTLLVVSGRMGATIGGPSVKDMMSPASTRRTLYGHVDRLQLPGFFRTFDFPSPDASAPQREQTTIPQQALFFLNSDFAIQAARRAAERIAANDAHAPARVRELYRLLFSRSPSNEELLAAIGFVEGEPIRPWDKLAHALLLTNEFVFVD